MNPQPSADALALAVKLSGHNHIVYSGHNVGCVEPCAGCLADAETINRDLQLPQKNAALLLAHGVCDIAQRGFDPYAVGSAIDELRDALAAIKSKP